jgi:hypothetical protein
MSIFDPKNWQGKVLYVYIKDAGPALQSGIPLCEARLEDISGRIFLVGRAPDDPRDWISNLPLMIAWDQVLHMLVMNSLEEYFDRVETASFSIQTPRAKDDVH